MPTFSLPTSPPFLTERLQPDGNAPLPRIAQAMHPQLGFRTLAPGIFGAGSLDQ